MDNHFLALLENRDLLREGLVRRERVETLTATEIGEIASEAALITSADDIAGEPVAFAQTASHSLSGDCFPCSDPQCRLGKASRLARFAALYSDRVYIPSLITRYADHPPTADSLDRDRRLLFADLSVLAIFTPLIEAGRVVPVSAPTGTCPACLMRRVDLDPETRRRSAFAAQALADRYYEEVTYTARYRRGEYQLSVAGPPDLLEHAIYYNWPRIPSKVASSPALLAKLRSGKTVRLTGAILEALGEPRRLAGEVMRNVMFELTLMQSIGTSFVTDLPIHADVLNSITDDPVVREANRVIQEHLTVLIPYAAQLSTRQLLHLRQNEEESFQVFRQALVSAVEAARGEGHEITEHRARQLFGDVLEPGVARIQASVDGGSRAILKSAVLDTVPSAAALSFGYFTGLLPASLAGAAATLGLGKVAADVARKVLSVADSEAAARADSLYFLWRVKRKADSLES